MLDIFQRNIPAFGSVRFRGGLPPQLDVADLELPTLVKIGYPTDGGAGDREHLWFEVHELRPSTVDATLLNQPWNVSHLKEGKRAEYPLENLSEWTMMTPLDSIQPHAFHARRLIRQNRAEVEAMVAAMSQEG
jgi:uncharacterized protein YegJ (DUF2314 family)